MNAAKSSDCAAVSHENVPTNKMHAVPSNGSAGDLIYELIVDEETIDYVDSVDISKPDSHAEVTDVNPSGTRWPIGDGIFGHLQFTR